MIWKLRRLIWIGLILSLLSVSESSKAQTLNLNPISLKPGDQITSELIAFSNEDANKILSEIDRLKMVDIKRKELIGMYNQQDSVQAQIMVSLQVQVQLLKNQALTFEEEISTLRDAWLEAERDVIKTAGSVSKNRFLYFLSGAGVAILSGWSFSKVAQ